VRRREDAFIVCCWERLANSTQALFFSATQKGGAIMTTHALSTPRPNDRLSYLWLALAFALCLCAFNGRWDIPLAAWLYPLFLLRFVRTHRPATGFLGACLVNVAATGIWLYQTGLPLNGLLLAGMVGGALCFALPYLADRLVSPRLGGWVSTLIFPLSFVTVDYLKMLVSPIGSMPSLAYTQYGDLPLLQLLSVTGIAGIVFLITWFASMANRAWEEHFAWGKIGGGTLLYGSLLASVLLGGGARLAFLPPEAQTVRVAGISVPPTVVTQAFKPAEHALTALFSGTGTQADRALARAACKTIDDDLLLRSEREASAGAKIIVWPEGGGAILQEDEPALLAQAAAVAQKMHIYLEMGQGVLARQAPYGQDKAILIDPQGRVIWSYEKAHPVPGQDHLIPGAGLVPTVDTPYGRISNVICFDGNFPALLRQAGQASVDLMLVPSNDWREIDPWHAQNSTFRAIENGFSLVRQTSHGLSIAVDYEGRVLASSDYFVTQEQVMVAFVPTKGVQTIYALVGDLFAQLCLAGVLVLMTFALVQSRSQRTIRNTRPEEISSVPEP
jgi:apolipoprotein N-acyltransferase